MTGTAPDRDDLVARSAVEALLAARWESADLLSRRPACLAADLLRGHAAELATSPFARDQVLSLALETAARDIDSGAAPLDQGAMFLFEGDACGMRARESIRDAVLAQPSPSSPTDVVGEFERRLAPEHLAASELSRRMEAEARLQEALWDDPRLTAQPAVRHAILCSVPRLTARAADLEAGRRRAGRQARRGRRRLRALVLRRPRRAAGWRLALVLLAAAAAASVLPIAAVLRD